MTLLYEKCHLYKFVNARALIPSNQILQAVKTQSATAYKTGSVVTIIDVTDGYALA